jgi:predicted XRE-type DNA-binding protein
MKPIRTLDELEEALRQKVRDTDQTLQKISQATGIAQSRLSDFKNGRWNFPMRKLNTLANHFEVRFRLENWKED